MITLILLMPGSSATSGYSWDGAAEISTGNTLGSVVLFSNSGDILASAHGNELMLMNPQTHDIQQLITVDFEIESLQFSDNDSFIVIGMESLLLNTPAAVVYELSGDTYVREKHTEDGLHIDAISIAPNNDLFAMSSENGGINEWAINNGTIDALGLDRQYAPTHDGHINCIDHSLDGKQLMSGGEDGMLILWNRTDQSEIQRWNTGNSVIDCKFNPDGTIMGWMSGQSLFMRNYDATYSYFGQVNIDADSTQFVFTNNQTEVAILTPIHYLNDIRHIQFYDISSDVIVESRRMMIAHVSLHFDISPNGEYVAISTNTRYVSIFSNLAPNVPQILPMDLDQDSIPDIIDLDSDGDGIPDDMDNVCIEGNTCHLHPDQEMIRQISLDIDGTNIMIRDSIHLTSEQSYQLRFLTSQSVIPNSVVESGEYMSIEQMICSEFNESMMLEYWSESIIIQSQQISTNSVQCDVTTGLEGTSNDDTRTRIQIVWSVFAHIPTPAMTPYNITIQPGIPAAPSSISSLVHHFPANVNVEDVSGVEAEYVVWNRFDPALTLYIDSPPPEGDSAVDVFVKFVESYWYVLFIVIISFIGIVFTIIRNKNAIDFDTDDDEYTDDADDADDADDEWEDMVDDIAEWDEEMESEYPTQSRRQPKPPAAVERDLSGQPKPPAAVKRDIRQQHTIHTVPTRKVRRTSPDDTVSDEIDFTHLVQQSDHDDDNVHDESDDEMDLAIDFVKKSSEKSMKKRRRPVRRKKSD
jgi:hypothetical protein